MNTDFEKIKNLLGDSFGLDGLKNDTPLFSNGDLDSMDVLRLMLAIENEFKIKIPAYEVTIEMFDTINGIASVISSRK